MLWVTYQPAVGSSCNEPFESELHDRVAARAVSIGGCAAYTAPVIGFFNQLLDNINIADIVFLLYAACKLGSHQQGENEQHMAAYAVVTAASNISSADAWHHRCTSNPAAIIWHPSTISWCAMGTGSLLRDHEEAIDRIHIELYLESHHTDFLLSIF